jgi:Glycosyltransferase family 87
VESRLRELGPAALVAGLCALLVGAIGLPTPEFTDYEQEVQPALDALRAGDVAGFLQLAPAYGGSLVLRSPFALLPELWGGGGLAVFRSMAAPCLLAAAVLAVFLWSRGRAIGLSKAACWSALVLVAANPLTVRALEIGHPEELLGAVLCVAAGLAAAGRRPLLAGALLGLAIANKPWAVLAVLPVLAMSDGGWARLLGAAAAAAGLVLLPLALGGGAAIEQAHAVATEDASPIFQPWQLWWFLGEQGETTVGVLAGSPGARIPPDWLAANVRYVVVAVPLAACVALLPRLRRRGRYEGLLLLALAMLLRCLLDPWDIAYYHLPFLLALVAWEVHERRGLPVLSLAVTLLAWLTLAGLHGEVHPDVMAAAYLAWSVPLAALLAVRLWAPERLGALGWTPRRELRA